MTSIPRPDRRVSLKALRALLADRSLLSALERFHAELGDIFELPLPGFNPIMLVGPEASRFVLVEEREHLRWRAERDPVTRLLRHGLLVEDGEAHDNLRRLMSPALHRRRLEEYVEVMWRCTDAVIDEWRAAPGPIDMPAEMRRIALLILMRTLFSVDMQPELGRLWPSILATLRYISPGPWILWRDVPRPGYRAAIRRLDDYLYRLVALRRRGPLPGDDLLGALIAAGLPDDLIRDQLLTMMIAGHDTSTALLAWALYLLSGHPEAQSMARCEVDTVLRGEPPDFARAAELRYLKQVIDETLRLYPPIHLGSRIAARDLDFRGVRIPAGRRVVYSIYLTHRDPRTWSRPADFIPERFAPDRPRQGYTFLPFGGGPRNCIGMAFAQVEAKVVLARILQKYDLTFTGHRVGIGMGATLVPQPGVWVNVRKRSPMPYLSMIIGK